jgi:ribonuclease PH
MTAQRSDGRGLDQVRPVRITPNYLIHPEGSALIECGKTHVICAASVEEKVPHFLRGSGSGWVTSEYGMLPRSTGTRMIREVTRGKPSGRTQEIQRLIGRALRSVVDLQRLGERTVWVDCDVIQADGGTRTAAITGSFVALALAIAGLRASGKLEHAVLIDYVAAVSVGIVGSKSMLDLNYEEDSTADVDLNVVMTGGGEFVEIQGTAEKRSFSSSQLHGFLDLAALGIQMLIDDQKKALAAEIQNLEALFQESVPVNP